MLCMRVSFTVDRFSQKFGMNVVTLDDTPTA